LPGKEDEGTPNDNAPKQPIKKQGVRLSFTFDNDKPEQIVDASGYGNHGIPSGNLKPDKGQNNEPAKRFDGNGYIDLKKTQSLVFAGLAWTTDTVFKSDKPDGVIISVGGMSQGYSLRLENGKLVAGVSVNGSREEITSPEKVEGWTKASVKFTSDKKIELYVNDKKVAEKQLQSLVTKEPNFAYRIGATSDAKSNYPPFNGIISSIKLTAEK
jgi:hypothetical protein